MDILVQGPVGTPNAPVRLAAGGTTPPNGWQPFSGDDGQFYEIRSRPIRFETEVGDAGFVPRARLGWQVSAMCIDTDSDGCNVPPVVVLSESIIGEPPVAAFQAATIADPAYGPVIRLMNSPDVEGVLYSVNFTIEEQKDEDRTPRGV